MSEENKIEKEENIPKVEKQEKQDKPSQSVFSNIMNGEFLTKDIVVGFLPFILFLAFLGMCYIRNGYYVEDTVRAINDIGSELKELKSEYISTKSELMFKSKQSEVAKALEPFGIKESVVPPKKIVVVKNN